MLSGIRLKNGTLGFGGMFGQSRGTWNRAGLGDRWDGGSGGFGATGRQLSFQQHAAQNASI